MTAIHETRWLAYYAAADAYDAAYDAADLDDA